MNTILTYLLSIFEPVVQYVETKLIGAFAAIINEQPADQTKILHDAITSFLNDRKAGKDLQTAATDTLNKFFSGEQGEVNKVVSQLFAAFVAGVEQHEVPTK